MSLGNSKRCEDSLSIRVETQIHLLTIEHNTSSKNEFSNLRCVKIHFICRLGISTARNCAIEFVSL